VISEDFAFFGFDEPSWDRLVSLVAEDNAPSGVLVVVVNRIGVPVASFHTTRGMLDPRSLPAPGDLPGLCAATEAMACIVMRDRTMGELSEDLAEPLGPDQDLASRGMRFAQVLRELGNGNWLRVWPNPFPDVLLAAAPSAKSTTDLLLPDGHSVVLGIFDDGQLWTGAVLRRQGGGFDAFAGPVAMAEWAGPLGGAWERDHRVIAEAVRQRLGEIHLGLFLERPTAERLFAAGPSGEWAKAYATRDLILHPMPPFAAAGLGLDVVRGAAKLAMQVVEGFDPEEMSTIAKGFWRGFTDGRGIDGLLELLPRTGRNPNDSGADEGESEPPR
jgi:hypothetical protein